MSSDEESDIVEKDSGTPNTSDEAPSRCTTPPIPLKVLITGGCGFLGSHIARCVYNRFTDSKLMLLDNNCGGFKGCKKMICGNEEDKRIELGPVDVTNDRQLNKCFSIFQPDVVFHCAGMSELSAIINERLVSDRMNEVNVFGTQCVVNACKTNGVRVLVYTGSIAQVLPKKSRKQLVVDEGYDFLNGNLLARSYGQSKMAGEKIVRDAGQRDDDCLKTCSIRCPPLYGEFDTNFIPNIALAAQKYFNLYPPFGNPDHTMAAMYVVNAAHAHVCAAEKLLHKDNNTRELVNRNFFFVGDDTPSKWAYDFNMSFLGQFGFRVLPRYVRLPIVITTILFYIFVAVILFFHAFFHINFPSPILNYRRQIKIVSVNHKVEWRRAESVLGYSPPICYKMAFDRSITSYKDHRTM